jgi:Ca-activated chloride channel family protein
LVGKDFEGYAAIASFYPSINNEFSAPPKNVTFLVDCSGSMQGVSIRSARHALSKAVKQLNCDDTMNIVLFGSRHTTLFDHPVKMSHENEKIIFNAIEHINADMGGTEIASALEAAYSVSKGIETDSYLFLITDGETYDHGTILLKARLSKMRHFIVGVGDATDSVLLQNMAQQTKGAFENVDPNEIMDESILRVFKKIDMPKATSLKIQWSQNPTETFEPEYLYNGDTLIAMARFKEAPEGKVLLNYTLDNGENHTTSTMIKHISDAEEDLSTIARVVANKKLKNTDLSEKEMILSLSERYNLFSTETKYLLVDEVAEGEKPTELPQIHKVKHMAQSDVYMCRSMSYDCSYDSTLSFDSLPELNYCESPRVSKVVLNRELKNIDEQDLEDFVNGLPEYLINHIVELLQMASAFGDDVFEGLTIKSLQKIGIDRTEIMDWISKQSNEKEAIEELLELILQRYAIIQQINESDIPKRKFGVLYAAKQKIANWARQLF